jgi:hypothetical protein
MQLEQLLLMNSKVSSHCLQRHQSSAAAAAAAETAAATCYS